MLIMNNEQNPFSPDADAGSHVWTLEQLQALYNQSQQQQQAAATANPGSGERPTAASQHYNNNATQQQQQPFMMVAQLPLQAMPFSQQQQQQQQQRNSSRGSSVAAGHSQNPASASFPQHQQSSHRNHTANNAFSTQWPHNLQPTPMQHINNAAASSAADQSQNTSELLRQLMQNAMQASSSNTGNSDSMANSMQASSLASFGNNGWNNNNNSNNALQQHEQQQQQQQQQPLNPIMMMNSSWGRSNDTMMEQRQPQPSHNNSQLYTLSSMVQPMKSRRRDSLDWAKSLQWPSTADPNSEEEKTNSQQPGKRKFDDVDDDNDCNGGDHNNDTDDLLLDFSPTPWSEIRAKQFQRAMRLQASETSSPVAPDGSSHTNSPHFGPTPSHAAAVVLPSQVTSSDAYNTNATANSNAQIVGPPRFSSANVATMMKQQQREQQQQQQNQPGRQYYPQSGGGGNHAVQYPPQVMSAGAFEAQQRNLPHLQGSSSSSSNIGIAYPSLTGSSSVTMPPLAPSSSAAAASNNLVPIMPAPPIASKPVNFLLPSTMMPPTVLASVCDASTSSKRSVGSATISSRGGGDKPGAQAAKRSMAKSGRAEAPQDTLERLLRQHGHVSPLRYKAEQASYDTMPSPLQLASFGTEMVKATHMSDVDKLSGLLNCGLSPNPCNQFRDSIMDLVCKRANSTIFDCLLQHGCDIFVCDGFGRTPLHHCCWASTMEPSIAQAILQRDINQLFIEDKHGQTPLEYVRADTAADWVDFLQSWVAPNVLSVPALPSLANVKEQRAEGALPNPPHALPIPLAAAVSSGKVTPDEVHSMSVEEKEAYGTQS